MLRVEIDAYGPPSVLRPVERAESAQTTGQVTVRVPGEACDRVITVISSWSRFRPGRSRGCPRRSKRGLSGRVVLDTRAQEESA